MVAPRPPPITLKEPPIKKEGETKKRSNQVSSGGANDFIAVPNLFDLVPTHPNNRGGVAARFLSVNPQSNPMPKLLGASHNGQPGKLTLSFVFPRLSGLLSIPVAHPNASEANQAGRRTVAINAMVLLLLFYTLI
jgi:hypothetical protein